MGIGHTAADECDTAALDQDRPMARLGGVCQIDIFQIEHSAGAAAVLKREAVVARVDDGDVAEGDVGVRP